MKVLKEPIISEKMTNLGKSGVYCFIVDPIANKLQIRQAIEKMYQVTVADVNTMRYLGKKSSRMTKAGVVAGKKPNFKKAIITLKKGDIIDFYSSI